jgi:hypothetical protein
VGARRLAGQYTTRLAAAARHCGQGRERGPVSAARHSNEFWTRSGEGAGNRDAVIKRTTQTWPGV